MSNPTLCVWFNEISRENTALAGGKGANLGDLVQAGLPVPPGYVVCTSAYRQMVEASGIEAEINQLMVNLDRNDNTQLQHVEQQIHRLFEQTRMNTELARLVSDYYHTLGDNVPVAVRSSATAEDLAGASFAGQQETFLNVRGDDAVRKAVRNCWASLFTSQAIFYRHQKGFDNVQVSMAVVVQKMITADKAGVLFTVDPIMGNHFQMMIEAVWGLGEGLVSGQITPDSYKIDREDYALIHEYIPKKTIMISKNGSDGVSTVAVPPENQAARVLSDSELKELVDLGNKVEKHFGGPQDIEWGVESDTLYLLQSRPITSL